MKLAKLRMRNFRCYRDETVITFEEITALIGKNDSGKSSVMDALDIFLNNGKPDGDDASKDGDAKDLTIICEFDDLPDEVIIDDKCPTNLEDEYLLNNDVRLEIHKSYSGNLKTPKCTSIEAIAMHPTRDGASDLLQLKNSQLKERATELGVSLEEIDKKINAEIRSKIWQSEEDLELDLVRVPLNEDNAKKVWDGLKKYLPAFALFQSDRPSTDQDPEAQDPMKAAVKEAIKSKEEELNEISRFVLERVQEIAHSTLDKLNEMDPTLASRLTPTFSTLSWDRLFKASIVTDDDIPINKRGSGVKRLILLNFFRAKAEQMLKQEDCTGVIYGIEEPETSQHPNNQRMLLRALSDLSSEAQVVISTHTPMLARAIPDRCLRYINVDEEGIRNILIGGPETNKIFVDALGVLPDNSVKLFIAAEGPRDITFLQSIACALIRDGVDLPNLEELEKEGRIIFIPLGGSTLAWWANRLEPLGRPEFHLCDRDSTPPEAPKYIDHIDSVNDKDNCKACCTGKREIENYIHYKAIVKAYEGLGISIDIESNFGPFEDVPMEIARLVHEQSDSNKSWDELSDKDKSKKESNAKKVLCALATREMTGALLDEIDQDGDVMSWFSYISNVLEAEE